jgi:hypothetical protein
VGGAGRSGGRGARRGVPGPPSSPGARAATLLTQPRPRPRNRCQVEQKSTRRFPVRSGIQLNDTVQPPHDRLGVADEGAGVEYAVEV